MTDKIASNVSQELPFNNFILTEEQTTYTSDSSNIELRSFSEENKNTPQNVHLTIQTFIQTFLEEEFHCESKVSMGTKPLVILRFSKLTSIETVHNRFTAVI